MSASDSSRLREQLLALLDHGFEVLIDSDQRDQQNPSRFLQHTAAVITELWSTGKQSLTENYIRICSLCLQAEREPGHTYCYLCAVFYEYLSEAGASRNGRPITFADAVPLIRPLHQAAPGDRRSVYPGFYWRAQYFDLSDFREVRLMFSSANVYFAPDMETCLRLDAQRFELIEANMHEHQAWRESLRSCSPGVLSAPGSNQTQGGHIHVS